MLKKNLTIVVISVFAAMVSLAVAETPKTGGSINVVIQPEPPGLMLGLVQNGPTQMVAGNIYEGLLRYDNDLKPMPSLATKWEITEGGTVYTFNLKKGVTWHDGKPMTAADVVFTAKEFLPKGHPRWRVTKTNVTKIEALDDYTVRFTLKQPFGPFLGAFEVGSMPIIPKHIYAGTDFKSNPANNHPIGTGPFKFNEWKKGSYIHLVKNKDYHIDGQPYLDEIFWHVIPDAAARAVAIETGKVDVLVPGSIEYWDIPRLTKRDDICMTSKGREFFAPHCWMWINNRHAPMSDKRFRQAIMYAINREFAREAVWNGMGGIPTGPISSKTRFYDDDVKKYPYDPEKAKALLKEMGYDGTPVRLLPLPYGETWQRFAEVVRQNLQDVGIKVKLVATDVAGWNQKQNEWDFDLAFTYLYQYGDPALGVARSYITSNIAKGSPWNNVGGYSNPKVDELFANAAVAYPDAKRQELYTEVQKILAEDVPVAWLLELDFPTIHRCDVQNLISTGIGVNNGFVDAWLNR